MDKRGKKAYMTIEAALVFPIVLSGIIFVIYLGFYLYNASVIRQMSYIAALRGSQLTQANSSQIKKYVEEQLQQLGKEKILGEGELVQDIVISFNEIKVKVEMKMEVPLMEGIPFVNRLWRIESEAKAGRINPVGIIRGVRKINESKISE
ncbi:MAG: pilus assembly protein [Lachnospiraceae bacterium]|nr:pilus assembly protein [Lachnospiraceae bacterium]